MRIASRWAAGAVLIAHLGVLIYLTVFLTFSLGTGAPVNFVPFAMMVHDLQEGGRHLVVNFLGNIVAFLPLGVLLPIVLGPTRAALRVGVIAAALSASIEFAQWVSGRRVADVDDVILNTLGAMVGYAVWVAWRKVFRPRAAG